MKVTVTGSSGFIGSHLVKYLEKKGRKVLGVDIKKPEFEKCPEEGFLEFDLRAPGKYKYIFEGTDEVYHLAANMGGIGFIESHKADIVYDNTVIDMNVLKGCKDAGVKKLFYSSSACVYPLRLQHIDRTTLQLREQDAYPAECEDGYGWEKLYMERAMTHFAEDYNMKIYIARFHNIYGPMGTFDGGREKSPAALCRKIAKVDDRGEIEVWGDGEQVRSYCYVDDCVEGIYHLMQSEYHEPMNIGSDHKVTINQLIDIIRKISGKKFTCKYDTTKPKGVTARNADIRLAFKTLKWEPKVCLEDGMKKTYEWIHNQIYPS